MMCTSMHGVKKIEYVSRYMAPSHEARTIRITTEYNGQESYFDITLFGNAEAIETLPKSEWFTDTDITGDETA